MKLIAALILCVTLIGCGGGDDTDDIPSPRDEEAELKCICE